MATPSSTVASASEHAIAVSNALADPAGGEERRRRGESRSSVVKPEKKLSSIVLCVALLEWAGNAVGTLASLWATVVLLGGFCTLLNPMDFWFATAMIFIEATRVFIRNDASVNQWLFGSTRAFRFEDFSFARMLSRSKQGNLSAVLIGVCIGAFPVFGPEIVAGIVKAALLVIFSHLLTRCPNKRVRITIIISLSATAVCARVIYNVITAVKAYKHNQKTSSSGLKYVAFLFAWLIGTLVLALLVLALRPRISANLTNPTVLLCFKVVTAACMACLPFFQAIIPLYYRLLSITAAVLVLMMLGTPDPEPQSSSHHGVIVRVVDTVLPILLLWTLIFPLSGISLKVSFCILFPTLAAVLVGNLQIPVAFLQVALSALRLRGLLGRRHDYQPLPQGASPILVPSIVVFFVLELCQGSSYVVATILGLVSHPYRGSLARALGFTGRWGAKAVDLYYHQAYRARSEKGLFPAERGMPSLAAFAVDSLGSASSEAQLVGLRILDSLLQAASDDSEFQKKLIVEIVKDAREIIAKIAGLITSYCANKQKNRGDHTQQKEAICSSLNLVRRLGSSGGRIGAAFRQELWENPFFLDSLQSIFDLERSQQELREPVIDVIAKLALDEATRQVIGSTQGIIGKLMHAFLRPDDLGPSADNYHSLRLAAGEALVNLTIMSEDNCWAILEEPGYDNLTNDLIDMLDNDYAYVAANLLYNLCAAHSRDKLIGLADAKEHLESAMPKVIEHIMTKEGKHLEAVLCAASQIGYAIPVRFAQVLESYTYRATLVKKLLDTLNSNMKPGPEYPRMRRVLVEMIISIVKSCPGYINIFTGQMAMDALDKVKRTPSRLEKYRVFLDGEGVVAESSPMGDLVDKAKNLIR